MLPKQRIALVATIVFSIVVGILCLSPRVGNSILGDKWAHFVAFTILVLPTAICIPHRLPETAAGLLLLGALIEIVQPFVGRSCDYFDFLADVFGLITGVILGFAARAIFRTKSFDVNR